MGSPLAIDLHRFELAYTMLDSEKAAGYRLFATKQGTNYPNPFNTQKTPFLFPFDLGAFGFNVYVKSALDKPAWWSAKIEFLLPPNDQPIPTKGYSGNLNPALTSQEAAVGNDSTPPLPPAGPDGEDGAGFTPILALQMPDQSPSREHLWQTKELGKNNPVKMRVTVTARNSYGVTPGNVIAPTGPVPNPLPNVVEVWIMCV